MIIVGVDYHPSVQQVPFLDTETGETGERRLNHSDGEAERFYRDLQRRLVKVRVGIWCTSARTARSSSQYRSRFRLLEPNVVATLQNVHRGRKRDPEKRAISLEVSRFIARSERISPTTEENLNP